VGDDLAERVRVTLCSLLSGYRSPRATIALSRLAEVLGPFAPHRMELLRTVLGLLGTRGEGEGIACVVHTKRGARIVVEDVRAARRRLNCVRQ